MYSITDTVFKMDGYDENLDQSVVITARDAELITPPPIQDQLKITKPTTIVALESSDSEDSADERCRARQAADRQQRGQQKRQPGIMFHYAPRPMPEVKAKQTAHSLEPKKHSEVQQLNLATNQSASSPTLLDAECSDSDISESDRFKTTQAKLIYFSNDKQRPVLPTLIDDYFAISGPSPQAIVTPRVTTPLPIKRK